MKKLKERLNNKLSKNGGFTLIEMLIVVAIIAILVAVSIPVINNALERTRHATDQANERAAKAEIMIRYLSDTSFKTGDIYFYDASEGSLKTKGATITPYGKCTNAGHGNSCGVIAVSIDTDGVVSMGWVPDASATAIPNDNLCGGKDAH